MGKYKHTKKYTSKDSRFDRLFRVVFSEVYGTRNLPLSEISRMMGITNDRFKKEVRRLGLILTPKKLSSSFGYITQPNASQKARRVLRKLGFIIPDGYEIHHRDGNRDNNAPENLMIVTHIQHRWIHLQLGLSEPNGDD